MPGSGAGVLSGFLGRRRQCAALTDAMPAPVGGERAAMLEQINRFIEESRRALGAGEAVAGAAGPPGRTAGRAMQGDFELYLSEGPLFAALADELAARHRLVFLLRSPLALLARWQTGAAELSRERLEAVARLDPDLGDKLRGAGSPLDRQVRALEWFLARAATRPKADILRYEDLFASPAEAVSRLATGLEAPASIISAAPEHHDEGVDLSALAAAARSLQPLAEPFYPGFGEAVEAIGAGRRSGGAASRPWRADFFVAGVQKGGTTALDGLLRTCPGIAMASRKEPHFFDDDRIDWTRPDYDAFHIWFQPRPAGKTVSGESTPVYLYWPGALERIRAYNPDAKFIVCLRHPAFRAYSHWLMENAAGKDVLTFSEAIGERGRSRIGQSANGAHRVYSYVERGLYAGQIEKLLSLFPRESVLFLRTDRLWRDTDGVLREVCGFLGVEWRGTSGAPVYVSPNKAGRRPTLLPEDRRRLDAMFARDIARTQTLTGLDLADWRDPAYAEPMAI